MSLKAIRFSFSSLPVFDTGRKMEKKDKDFFCLFFSMSLIAIKFSFSSLPVFDKGREMGKKDKHLSSSK